MKKYEIIQRLDMIDNLLDFHFRNYGEQEDPINSVWNDSNMSDSSKRASLHGIRLWLKEIQNAIEEEKIYGQR